jgi:hypothetical protein
VAAVLAGAGRCGSGIGGAPLRAASLWQRYRPRLPGWVGDVVGTVMQDPEGNEFCIAVKSFTGWD